MSWSYDVVWKNRAACYSRRGNFGGSLVRSLVLIYSARWHQRLWFEAWQFEGVGSFGTRVWELKVVKSCFYGAFPIHLSRHCYITVIIFYHKNRRQSTHKKTNKTQTKLKFKKHTKWTTQRKRNLKCVFPHTTTWLDVGLSVATATQCSLLYYIV